MEGISKKAIDYIKSKNTAWKVNQKYLVQVDWDVIEQALKIARDETIAQLN